MNDIILGDCLEKMKDIPDNSIDMILTDLPYGVTNRNKWDIIIPFDKLWEQWNRIKKETTPIILTATQPFASMCIMSKPEFFKYEWIWEKEKGTGFLNSKKQPLRNHEQILVFYDKQCVYNPQMTKGEPYIKKQTGNSFSTNYGKQKKPNDNFNSGYRYPLTIVEFSRESQSYQKGIHPTQKPVALFEYLIKTYTNEGDTVLDCCAGSGTTGVACKNLNRNYILIEKEQEYYDIIKERLK